MKADAGKMRAALSSPPSDIRLFLLHGPDEAGASALAALLGTAMGSDTERVEIDGAALKNDTGRLADEAASMSLFGGARYIRVNQAGEESLAAFETLLAADRAGNPVVAIAPGVRSTAKIVKLALDSRMALAHACYEPSAKEAEAIAATLGREQGLQITSGVARRIVEATGGDRAIMAREIEKFALYLDAAPDRPKSLDEDSIDAVGADLDDGEQTALIEALIDGRPGDLGRYLDALGAAGTSPIPWLRALVRRIVALAEMRAEIDAGESPDVVTKRHRVFFKEEAATKLALRRWNPAMLATALSRARLAERALMASGTVGPIVADAAAVEIARAAAARR